MSFELTPEELAVYRETAQRRWNKEQRELSLRRRRAWEVAHRAGALLKGEFGAAQVVAFGSLVHGYWFSNTSDVDLAAWGLKDEDYFNAVAKVQDLSPDYKVDLVSFERCQPEFRKAIIKEGEII